MNSRAASRRAIVSSFADSCVVRGCHAFRLPGNQPTRARQRRPCNQVAV